MSKLKLFKWRHYEANIILRCVRWYCTYPLSYRQVAEMVNERGMDVHHTTIYGCVANIELGRRVKGLSFYDRISMSDSNPFK